MGKSMWHKMGAIKGAPRGGEGERLWVSEKTEPPEKTDLLSFQPRSNNNQQKNQTSRAFQGNSPSPNDHPCIIFVYQENNKHFQPRMRLKESLNTKGITAAATQELIKN